MITRRTFILFSVGFVAGICHGCNNDDDSEGTL